MLKLCVPATSAAGAGRIALVSDEANPTVSGDCPDKVPVGVHGIDGHIERSVRRFSRRCAGFAGRIAGEAVSPGTNSCSFCEGAGVHSHVGSGVSSQSSCARRDRARAGGLERKARQARCAADKVQLPVGPVVIGDGRVRIGAGDGYIGRRCADQVPVGIHLRK